MLLSSSGVVYAQHYCGEYEMLSEITLGEKHLTCGMAMEAPGCDDQDEEPGCCDNHYTKVDTDDTFVKSTFEIDLSLEFATVFVTVFVLKEDKLPSNHDVFYTDNSPPPRVRDLQVLYETFLI